MKTKNKFIFGSFLFGLLFLMALVSATITINNPTASEAINGSFTFNITTDQGATENCTWSTTGNSSFAFTINTSAGQTEFINITATSQLTDAKDTTLTVSCSNDTEVQTATRTISVDNTNPVCSFAIGIGEETVNYLDAWGVYPTDSSTDTTTLTYFWTLWDPSINSQTNSTSSTPNFAGDNLDEIGDFTLGLVVTDEVGKTNTCSNTTIMVKGTEDDEGQVSSPTFIKKNQTTLILVAVVFVLILILVLSMLMVRKSKR